MTKRCEHVGCDNIVVRSRSRYCGKSCSNRARSYREVIICDSYAKVPLTKGKYALIDVSDIGKVMQFGWHAAPSKSHGGFYAKATLKKGTNIAMHRIILDVEFTNKIVDHISGDTLDNRRCNLRLVSFAQNQQNKSMSRMNRSGFKGVRPARKTKNKWTARIRSNGEIFHLGTFNSPEQAARAYDAKAEELFGEYAKLNFQKEGSILSANF